MHVVRGIVEQEIFYIGLGYKKGSILWQWTSRRGQCKNPPQSARTMALS